MANAKVLSVFCPTCNSPATLIDSRIFKQERKRRYLCIRGHRWSVVSDAGEKQQRNNANLTKRTFTDDQIEEILLSTLSNKRMAAKISDSLGTSISHGAIAKVRAGETYVDIHPEIDRASLPSKILNKIVKKGAEVEWATCDKCIQWSDRCLLGIPEQSEIGLRYASECSAMFER
jgi:hypothetical protein